MIRDLANVEVGGVLQAEVGIVGAGFAGIDLARVLGRQGISVVLVESGRWEFDVETQKLANVDSTGKPLRTPDPDGIFTPYLPPIYRGESRVRQFGGTSNIWTGKWRQFDGLDFAPRSWVPYSGWPIGLEDVRPFYEEVARDYGLEDFDAFARTESLEQVRGVLDAAGLKLSFHFWEGEPTRPARRFLEELRRATNVDVVLGANATEIMLDDHSQRVSAVRGRSLEGRPFTLVARQFVLAMGGMEATRLLLVSLGQGARGLSSEHSPVGRFYMDHPKHKRGTVRPGPTLRRLAAHTVTRPRPRFHVSFALSDQVQERHRLLNHAVYLSPVYRYEVAYPTERVAALKAALRGRRPGRLMSAAFALLRSPSALTKVLQRVVYRDWGGPIAHYAVSMYVEQAPNPASALMLGPGHDALGMPRLTVDWRLTALDHEAFERLLGQLVEAFAVADLGALDFGSAPFTLDHTVDAAHHIGATRMAATPAEGVVDRDCRVFGTDNLFIASSSVFPTGHACAPTFTILALARRLAAHLLSLRRETASAPARTGQAASG